MNFYKSRRCFLFLVNSCKVIGAHSTLLFLVLCLSALSDKREEKTIRKTMNRNLRRIATIQGPRDSFLFRVSRSQNMNIIHSCQIYGATNVKETLWIYELKFETYTLVYIWDQMIFSRRYGRLNEESYLKCLQGARLSCFLFFLKVMFWIHFIRRLDSIVL